MKNALPFRLAAIGCYRFNLKLGVMQSFVGGTGRGGVRRHDGDNFFKMFEGWNKITLE